MSSSTDLTLYTDKGLPPNGWYVVFASATVLDAAHYFNRKVIIILEELGLKYKLVNLNLSKGEQKSAAFTAINPNGRIPALVDHKENDFIVWYACFLM